MKILITCALEARTYKLISLLDQHELILADYGPVPANLGKHRFISLGAFNPEVQAHTLLTACLDENVTVCIPLALSEMRETTISRTLFEEFNIDLIVPEQEALPPFFTKDEIFELSVFAEGRDLLKGIASPDGSLSGVFHNHLPFIARP